MTIRTDVSVNFGVSPRIVTVQAPSVGITIQDLHDTLNDILQLPHNQSYPRLILSAGKEDLGGGTLVGVTSTLQDAQLAFAARTIILEAGTETTGGDDQNLTDSAATYVTNLVARGDLVFNVTDGSSASVIRVVGENQLITTRLTGGTLNVYTSGDAYAIYDVIQCNITGGNLVAIDALGASLDPVFTTFGTQVVRTASSSATLQEQSAIQFSSFEGGVTIDVLNGTAGTEFPAGTPQQPVNNLTDTLSIMATRGLTKIFVLGDITLTTGLDFTGVTFVGEGEFASTITIDAGATTDTTSFSQATLNGVLDTSVEIRECVIAALTLGSTFVYESVIAGPVTLTGNLVVHFLDCWSNDPGIITPVIDMGGDGPPLTMRNYSGGITLTNKTGLDAVSLDMVTGRIVLDSTVGAGIIQCRGVARLDDVSTGATVINELLDPTVVKVIEQILRNKLITDPITGIMSLRNDADTADLFRAPVYESTDTSIPYKGTGIQRRDRLIPVNDVFGAEFGPEFG